MMERILSHQTMTIVPSLPEMSVKGNRRNKTQKAHTHGTETPRPIMTAPVGLLFSQSTFQSSEKCVDGTGHTGRDRNCFLPQVDDTHTHKHTSRIQ